MQRMVPKIRKKTVSFHHASFWHLWPITCEWDKINEENPHPVNFTSIGAVRSFENFGFLMYSSYSMAENAWNGWCMKSVPEKKNFNWSTLETQRTYFNASLFDLGLQWCGKHEKGEYVILLKKQRQKLLLVLVWSSCTRTCVFNFRNFRWTLRLTFEFLTYIEFVA